MVVDRLKKSVWTFRTFTLAILSIAAAISLSFAPTAAQAETRSLKLYYVHTREKAEIVFKRDGRYDQAGLKKLNVFLRDWRRNEPTNMDPRLFDLIWAVYRASGSRDYINVVSAYRSPTTNNMLRSRSANSGVAKNSQHTLGHAMDFYLPDVNLAKLRAIGLKQQVGGVGYYPKSGSPFVHMDVGSVRHWPRMSRKELMALFPDGKTMHIPSDGKPLAGYAQAKADWQARRGAPVVVASASGGSQKRSLFGAIFGKKDNSDSTPSAPVRVQPTAPRAVEPEPTVVSLPGKDAPLPEASPLRGNVPQPAVEEDDGGDDATVMAYANVPVPSFKPDAPAAVEQNTINVASIPLPDQRPVQQDAPDNVALAIASQDDTHSNALQAKVPADDLTALIEANDIIAVPDDDYEEDDDYADADAQSADTEMVASIDTTKTAPKVDRPAKDDLAKLISDDAATEPARMAPEDELRKVPNVVFVSGLEKKDEVSRVAELRGKAIDFHAVARINETY